MKFSSPQRGSFLSTMNSELIKSSIATVFVPSTGFFSIYKLDTMYETGKLKVFVPSTGFFSIYDINLTYSNKVNEVFVPSTGFFSIYSALTTLLGVILDKFSSPQRGSFLSTFPDLFLPNHHHSVFVPSTGFFSIYPASRSPRNLVFSRRICGGNRIHLRNLSKKYIFSSKPFILWAAGQNIVLDWSVCHISHTHIIQFSLVFCTLTYVRCYFQANILCMFMRSIGISQRIFINIIDNSDRLTAI